MTLGALGMLSGALSWALVLDARPIGLDFHFDWNDLSLKPLSIYPGLVFGLVIGVLFHRRGKLGGYRLVGYVLAAGLAYACAFHVADQVIVTDVRGKNWIVGGMLAGLAGSFLLGLMTMLLLRTAGRVALRLPVAIGTVAGALLALPGEWGQLAFFVLWQGAYAASLAPILRPAPRSK